MFAAAAALVAAAFVGLHLIVMRFGLRHGVVIICLIRVPKKSSRGCQSFVMLVTIAPLMARCRRLEIYLVWLS